MRRRSITLATTAGLALASAVILSTAALAGQSQNPLAGTTWSADAESIRNQVGKRFDFRCPPRGSLAQGGTIYGTNIYTTDSGVCTAAVHAGLITPIAGGRVTITILSFGGPIVGSTRNGVTTRSYGEYHRYSFVRPPKAPTGPILDGGRTWKATAAAHASKVGNRYRYSCPPGGKLAVVRGSNVYAVSSSVCSAAVHAGQISVTQGGNVVIRIQPGRASYAGTVKNGVTSRAAGKSNASFVFVKA